MPATARNPLPRLRRGRGYDFSDLAGISLHVEAKHSAGQIRKIVDPTPGFGLFWTRKDLNFGNAQLEIRSKCHPYSLGFADTSLMNSRVLAITSSLIPMWPISG